jgi:FkbM family methyltransferase
MTRVVCKLKLQGLFSYLIRRLILRFLYFRTTICKQIVNGKLITLNLSDLEQRYLVEDCIREPENLVVYKAIAKAKLAQNFIDVGANCGHVALSVLRDFEKIILIEPNPNLIPILKDIFIDEKSVFIQECAIVDNENTKILDLFVPQNSSGLGSVGGTSFSNKHGLLIKHEVKAVTLIEALGSMPLKKAYIKIDVEGLEAAIIESSKNLINDSRLIVGFEALSSDAAVLCSKIFKDYVFYCSRFNFMEVGGALSKSGMNIIKAILFGSSIEVISIDIIKMNNYSNYSQIFAVPNEVSSQFEVALNELWGSVKHLDLKTFSRLES